MTRRWRSRRAAVAVVGAVVALGLVATGIALSRDGNGHGQAHPGLAAGDFPEPGVLHVHGLGVDPADGTLYAATHSGLFRIPEQGAATRVANRYQDTRGFTVAGPGTFLGSGHPDLREDLPSRLGLIRSTDAGETWTALSLQGQADFHALRAAHGRVYGFDATSGAFMVSEDGRRWQTRSRVALRDVVVSPSAPDVLLATAREGLVRSVDGGRTWTPVRKAPAHVVLAWPAASSLYGVAADGTLHHSADGGVTWQARGGVGGQPEAMAVDAREDRETVFVAVAGRGILASTDGGRTFVTRYAD